MGLKQKVLGNPFVYNHVRPLAVGGIDMSPFYGRVGASSDSIILDIGCGTGDALRYVESFGQYVGVDTDPVAIEFARARYGSKPRVSFQTQYLTAADVERIGPTHVLLAGVLHHLSDEEAHGILGSVRRSARLTRVVTQDIVYLPGKWVNNFFASMDRGKYCRKADGYRGLAERSGFAVTETAIVQCHPVTGLAWYVLMTLDPT